MTRILVVCTGNVCRSPIAEGLLRAAFAERMGPDAPEVASAGTMGWTGSRADPSSVRAAAELGVDISGHRAREVSEDDVARADLVVAMAPEHAQVFAGEAGSRTFTLKELVRLLEALPETEDASPGRLSERIAQADRLRRGGFEGDPRDEGIADPLGMPLDAFRAVAAELDAWCSRLADGLVGRTDARTATGSTGS
jgi:low molecular weight protein-tyrosine phosphatase